MGALLSMSSTSVVVKCLESYRMNGTAFGQITIGTLILQVRLSCVQSTQACAFRCAHRPACVHREHPSLRTCMFSGCPLLLLAWYRHSARAQR